jgi:hypothetical protein
MLSVVLYGRNDSHGYNLHKRAAISFNAIAELLQEKNDEIVFVDYNTPNDFPTFPEAIFDTFTEKCRKLLRIIRVRPKYHTRFKGMTDLVAIEPISRNVGFRRTNPANKWILSTNTDMIFVPHAPHKSLDDVVRDLPDGYYGLPRFELPDLMWESLDRMDGKGNMEKLAHWGKRYHIDEIIEKPPEILFDAPGDFQLFTRKDIHAIDGFDERYVLGWHLDSNVSKRFSLIYGKLHSLQDRLSGWHCNHTRTQTIAHKSGRRGNDLEEVSTYVVRPELPHQHEDWGLGGETLEEINFDIPLTQKLTQALDRVIADTRETPYFQPFIASDCLPCPSSHLKPYIADILYTYPRDIQIGYVGYDQEQFKAFYEVWKALGFTGPLVLVGPDDLRGFSDIAAPQKMEEISIEDADERCGLFVGDYIVLPYEKAGEEDARNKRTLAAIRQLIFLERKRSSDKDHVPRKFIVLNGVQWPVAQLLQQYTNMQENPFGTRIRHGTVVPQK